MAQVETPVQGDWWENVVKDMSELHLEMSLIEIQSISKKHSSPKSKQQLTEKHSNVYVVLVKKTNLRK